MSAIPPAPVRATIEDVLREPGKAELIRGKVVRFPMTDFVASRVANLILFQLMNHQFATRTGEACGDGCGFRVPVLASGRESFGPDAAYLMGVVPRGHRDFVDGPPDFAVEVRSKGDYGTSAEREMAAKRADYFEAGTKVVWDVDPDAETIACYREGDPLIPQIFHSGDDADAEPAVPGWRVAVAWVFMDV